ncbi:MAG: glycosyltransferase family 4 protein [Chitinophagaceae bacterium]|nr:glycosyltransferase family 4 protein [Chitinophagaceae bacterium]
MTYKKARLKFFVEEIIMFPFVFLGKIAGIIFPLKTTHDLFFFFPNADIGGAPRVNIDITNCVRDKKPLIIFSKKPKNNQFKDEFNIEGVRIIDLHKYIDNKFFHFVNFFFRGVIASWVNRREKPVLLGGECMFFYKVIPHVKKQAKCVELSHLPTWLNYNLGHIKHIDLRIFSTLKLKQEVIEQYKKNNIDKQYFNRLLFIDNAIDIPEPSTVNNQKLEIVFIGRGSPQKRVYLITAIAKKMFEAGDAVHFSFVGDVENVINIQDYPFCTFYGNIKDQEKMESIYAQSDVLILTSAFEGLPVVVMKMMAHGKVVLSTAVNGIPDYIEHMKNGLLVYETDEEKIVEKNIQLLRELIRQPELKNELGKNNREVAIEMFSRKVFCRFYRNILVGVE